MLKTVAFYGLLGFDEAFRLPDDDDPGYVSLTRDGCELAVVADDWPRDQYGLEVGDRPRFEMFVYVDNAEVQVRALRAVGVEVIKAPAAMPWGEIVGFVKDPDGNPVAIAQAAPAT